MGAVTAARPSPGLRAARHGLRRTQIEPSDGVIRVLRAPRRRVERQAPRAPSRSAKRTAGAASLVPADGQDAHRRVVSTACAGGTRGCGRRAARVPMPSCRRAIARPRRVPGRPSSVRRVAPVRSRLGPRPTAGQREPQDRSLNRAPLLEDRDELSEAASGSSATLSGTRSGCRDLADSHPGDVILCARVARSNSAVHHRRDQCCDGCGPGERRSSGLRH